MKMAPCAKFTIFIKPMVRDRPVPRRNNMKPYEMPIIKEVIRISIQKGAGGTNRTNSNFFFKMGCKRVQGFKD